MNTPGKRVYAKSVSRVRISVTPFKKGIAQTEMPAGFFAIKIHTAMSEMEKYQLILDALKRKAAEILPKGSQMSLYGSRARGDASPDSDWDIHILIPGEEKIPFDLWDKYAWPLVDVGISMGEEINPRLYSFAGWLKRSFLPFYKNLEKDKLTFFRN